MNKEIIRVALYVRVSSEEQVKFGDSIDTQINLLNEYVKNHPNMRVVNLYADEGISARKPASKRNGLQQLLANLDNIDMVLFTKIDRWFRNISEYYRIQDKLEKNNVVWKAILEDYDTSTSDGRLKVNIMLSVAENEADRTSDRIKVVFNNKVAKGEPITGMIPLGYKIATVDGKKKHIIDEDKAPIVKDIFDTYLLCQSYRELCSIINDKYNLTYDVISYKRMLHKEAYTGRYKGNENFFPRIISDDVFNKVNEIAKNRNIKHAPSNRIYLFTGLLTCPVCGSTLKSRVSRNTKGEIYATYYVCPKHNESKKCPYKYCINESYVENYLVENIVAKVDEEIKGVNIIEKKETVPRKTVRQLEDRLSRLNKIYVMGNITDEEYVLQSTNIKKELSLIDKPQNKTDFKAIQRVLDTTLRTNYGNLNNAQKRELWHSIVKKITLEDSKIKGIEL